MEDQIRLNEQEHDSHPDSGQIFTFKTNINCGGCLARVTSALDSSEGICHWEVDLNSKEKTLSIHSDGISEKEIIETVQQAGFDIEPLN